MKKSLLIISTVVVLFTACSDNDTFKSAVQEQQAEQPLSFSAFADKVTKGTNSTALNDFYTVFGVYGWKTVNGAVVSDPVFSNTPNEYFTADEGGSKVYNTSGKPSVEWAIPDNIGTGEGKKGYWYYENVRYWDKMASEYQFFAIAPYDDATTPVYSVTAIAPDATDAQKNNNFSIYNSESKYDISKEYNLARTDLTANPVSETATPKAELTFSGFKKDFMIADKKTVKPLGTVTTTDVQLVFHHILTKLNVKIQKDSNYKGQQILKVNELKIANLAKEGYYEYNTNMTTNGWTKNAKYDIDINTEYALANAQTNYSGNYWIETLIFPQTTNCKAAGAQPTANDLTDLYLYIQYQIGDEEYNVYYDLAYVFDNTTAPIAATYYTAAEAAAYNEEHNLVSGDEGFKSENDEKTPAVAGKDFEFKPGSQYNLTLTVGPAPIHFDAEVNEWTTYDAGEVAVN